ncbi:hypothetical protein LINPERPRIM_LOCUS22290 [Linum perenne]
MVCGKITKAKLNLDTLRRISMIQILQTNLLHILWQSNGLTYGTIQMHLSGEEVDKMSVWKKSRSMTNPDVIEAVEMYEDLLSKEPEDQRKLIAVRDRIFHIVMGDDGHGYCRTYGSSVPRHLVYPKPSTLSETTNDLLKKLIKSRDLVKGWKLLKSE